MDSLAQYSSSEESLDTENTSERTDTSPAPHIEFPVPDFTPFSENYAMNRHKLVSSFISIPWITLAASTSKINAFVEATRSAVLLTMPSLRNRYNFFPQLASRTEVYGKFGFTNVRSVNDLHVSLFPNVSFPGHKAQQFESNLRKALALVVAPQELIIEKPPLPLDIMIGKDEPKQFIAFDFAPKLCVFTSSLTGALFIGVSLTPDDSGSLAQTKFLRGLSSVVRQQADVIGGNYKWSTMVSRPNELLDDGLPQINFHVTLMVGETPNNKRISTEEFYKLKDLLELLEVSRLLGGLRMEARDLVVRGTSGPPSVVSLVPS